MKVQAVEAFLCDAGWRPWIFVKITTDDGLVGWSECTDSNGAPAAFPKLIETLAQHVVGQDPRNIVGALYDMRRATRQSPGGLIQKGIAGIENALWDIKAKALDVPIFELLGGAVRDRFRAYWSHCGTSRVRAADIIGVPAIRNLDDLASFCREALVPSGITGMKTNVLLFSDEPLVYMPGFKGELGAWEGLPARQVERGIETLLGTLRANLPPDFDICLDLNFNFDVDGYKRVAKLCEAYDLMWLEMDLYDPHALETVTRSTSVSVCSGENLYLARGYEPFLRRHAMDVVMIDVVWNGLSESRRIAELAEMHDLSVTPHNYYSHLSTFMSAHFSATVPNARALEVDIDDVPWKDDLTTSQPTIRDGWMVLPRGPGWGANVNEEVLLAHPWKHA